MTSVFCCVIYGEHTTWAPTCYVNTEYCVDPEILAVFSFWLHRRFLKQFGGPMVTPKVILATIGVFKLF